MFCYICEEPLQNGECPTHPGANDSAVNHPEAERLDVEDVHGNVHQTPGMFYSNYTEEQERERYYRERSTRPTTVNNLVLSPEGEAEWLAHVKSNPQSLGAGGAGQSMRMLGQGQNIVNHCPQCQKGYVEEDNYCSKCGIALHDI